MGKKQRAAASTTSHPREASQPESLLLRVAKAPLRFNSFLASKWRGLNRSRMHQRDGGGGGGGGGGESRDDQFAAPLDDEDPLTTSEAVQAWCINMIYPLTVAYCLHCVLWYLRETGLLELVGVNHLAPATGLLPYGQYHAWGLITRWLVPDMAVGAGSLVYKTRSQLSQLPGGGAAEQGDAAAAAQFSLLSSFLEQLPFFPTLGEWVYPHGITAKGVTVHGDMAGKTPQGACAACQRKQGKLNKFDFSALGPFLSSHGLR